MATLLDYLNDYKDKTIEEFPFNDVDAGILAQFTYLNVDLFINDDKFYPISYFNSDIEKLTNPTLFVKKNKVFYDKVINSTRFKDFTIGELSIYNDEESQTRFCAMTFKYQNLYFISFRGTDLTILGWVEDFNMAIYDEIPSQKLSREYCKRIIKEYPGKYYLIGHSKGGNMAAYAGIFMTKKDKDKIIKIYDFDGPGFKQDITKTEQFKYIENKVVRVMPQTDFFGVLLNGNGNYYVVKSNAFGVMQHDITTWQVKDAKFVYVSKLKHASQVLGKSTLIWLDTMTYEEKSDFICIVYSIFNQAGITSVDDFKRSVFKSSGALLKVYSKENKETKKMIRHTFRRLINLYIKEMFVNDRRIILRKGKNEKEV